MLHSQKKDDELANIDLYWKMLTPKERELAKQIQLSERTWSPYPGPQTQALQSKADILLYGGAAGGGKTDLLLGAARNHERAIIFRRVFPNLRGIIDRSFGIYKNLGGKYNLSSHTWKFEDAKVLFGHLQYEDNKFDYQGQPFTYHGFDEITEFTESQFRFVTGWNRSTTPGQRCRVIATANPPMGTQGEWIIRYWAPWLDPYHKNPAKPGELRWFTTVNGKDVELDGPEPVQIDGEWITPKSRTFIPARVQDNPALMEAGYISTLQSLPEPMRSKLLYGDFVGGGEEDPFQVIPSEWVRIAQERWRNCKPPETPLTALGVDVARGGKDQTIITPRWDNYFGWQRKYPGSETPDGPKVAALIIAARDELGGREFTKIKIDIIGVGSSPFDFTKGMHENTYAMCASGGSDARDKSEQLGFINLRAEWWWKLREALDPASGQDLAIPDDRELMVDLCTPRWKPSARGIQIESKDEIKKRIGRSPDKGDSLVYAHAETWGVGDNLLAFYEIKDRMAAANVSDYKDLKEAAKYL